MIRNDYQRVIAGRARSTGLTSPVPSTSQVSVCLEGDISIFGAVAACQTRSHYYICCIEIGLQITYSYFRIGTRRKKFSCNRIPIAPAYTNALRSIRNNFYILWIYKEVTGFAVRCRQINLPFNFHILMTGDLKETTIT